MYSGNMASGTPPMIAPRVILAATRVASRSLTFCKFRLVRVVDLIDVFYLGV